MGLKPGRVRVGTWFEAGSKALKDLDDFCKEQGMRRGPAIRHIVVEWLKIRNGVVPFPSLTIPNSPLPTGVSPQPQDPPAKNTHKVRENKAAIANLDLD